MIFGADIASSMGMRFAPGTEAQPGVCGRGILRGIVAGERRLAEKGLIVRGLDHLEGRALGIGAVDVVAMDDDVFESLLLPFAGDVVGEFVVALRSGNVRLLRED